MKKLFFLMAIVCVTALSASAQYYPSAKFNIGIDGGVPLGTVSSYYSGTAGISFQYQFPIGLSPINLVLSTGYMGYFTDSGYGGYYDDGFGGGAYYSSSGDVASFIPVEAGLKYYFNRHIFIEGDAGVSFNINSDTKYYTGSQTAFIYAPGIGYAMPVGFSKASVELSLRYESRLETDWGYNQLALRAAFCFGGK